MTQKERVFLEIAKFKARYGGKKLVAGVDYQIYVSKEAQEREAIEARNWALNLLGTNSFDTDLKIGERAERFLLEKLREEFPTLKKIEGYNPEYDLIDDNGYSFEVKLDMRSKTTGNVGIEYRHNGMPSAISTSTAMEWVIIYHFNTWRYARIKTTLLRAFIKNNWEYFAKFRGKGDKSSLVLIPTKELEDYFFCSDINYYKPLDNTLGGV